MKIKIGAILIIALLAIVALFGFISPLDIFGTINTRTVGYTDHGCEGASPDASYDIEHPLPPNKGELLDSTAYVTSWDANGLSEKIVVSGYIRRDLNWQSIADVGYTDAYYRIEFTRKVHIAFSDGKIVSGEPRTVYESPHFSVGTGRNLINNNQWYAIGTFIFYVEGPIVGGFSVELWVKHYVADVYWPPNNFPATWSRMQHDEAYLLSGVGKVTVPKDVVEEGTYVKFHVETGASHSQIPGVSGGGWLLKIFSPADDNINTSNAIYTRYVPDWYNGDIKWLVPVGSYKDPQDPKTPPYWDNKFTVALYNTLFKQAHAWFFTVGPGMLNQIPNKPTFEIIKGTNPMVQGQEIEIRITAIKTTYDIKDFIVKVQYTKGMTGTSSIIIDDTHYPATKVNDTIFTATVSFIAPEPGTISIWASAYDVKGLNSGTARFDVTATPYYPPAPPSSSPEGLNFPRYILALLGIVMLLFGLLAKFFIRAIPNSIVWILIGAGAFLIILYILLVSVTPVIEELQ